jgi:CheY-like chemotaxis protein
MKTVLIVDDKKEVRELVEVTLRNADYRFLHASSGPEAVEMAAAHKPDLVILDIMMPGLYDGLEAARRIRSEDATRKVHIIMLTARGDSVDLRRGQQVGVNAYLIKPFGPLELIRTVNEVTCG